MLKKELEGHSGLDVQVLQALAALCSLVVSVTGKAVLN